MKNDLVSIIIPIYNAEKYLNKCIDSILIQTYNNLEIILVDDGSSDNSPKICDEYSNNDKRIKVYHIENKGVSNARNFGISKSTGKYLMFIDSDDWAEKEYVEKFINALVDGVDYVQSNSNIFENDKVMPQNVIKENKIIDNLEPVKLSILSVKYGQKNYYANSRCCWCKIYISKIIKDNKILFNRNIYLLEDGVFNLEYLKYCKKGMLLSECLYNYRQIITSASHRYNKDQIKQYQMVEKEIKKFVNNQLEEEYLYVISFQHLLTYIIRNIRFNKERNIKDIKNICKNDYCNTIQSVKYKHLINSEKIMLFLLRIKQYRIIYTCLIIKEKLRGKK